MATSTFYPHAEKLAVVIIRDHEHALRKFETDNEWANVRAHISNVERAGEFNMSNLGKSMNMYIEKLEELQRNAVECYFNLGLLEDMSGVKRSLIPPFETPPVKRSKKQTCRMTVQPKSKKRTDYQEDETQLQFPESEELNMETQKMDNEIVEITM